MQHRLKLYTGEDTATATAEPPVTITLRTCDRAVARLRTTAVTSIALNTCCKYHCLLCPECRIVEVEIKGHTDIAAAFDPAFASVPPCYVPHFILLSDGNETSGDALASAVRAGAPISTVALPASEAQRGGECTLGS